MKQFFTFVKKEFKHVFRDRKTLLMLFGLPIVQIVLFGFALSNEIKNSKIVVLDLSKDYVTRELINEIEASNYFEIEADVRNKEEVEAAFRSGKIKSAILFPANFANDLFHGNRAQVQVIADGSDPNTATTLTNYLSSIIQSYQISHFPAVTGFQIIPQIRMLYNPELKGAPNFVPGVMALVLMLVCVMMTSISIVREKELGTMEVLLVSPFKPLFVILAKAVPYLILSLVNLIVILLLSVFALGLPVNGSITLLFVECAMYIITALSLGLLISTTTASQQTAMLLSLMGMLLPTLLFAGFMFPIENMPLPLQIISNIVPAKWFYIIVKSIMIKGLGFYSIWKESLILFGMTLFLLTLSLRKFKVRLA
ncbi:MAG TPA: multidrug ABC transporter permease [Cytophagales bacterium]|nr:multidrug ABC transporter permease [Cytophagales bacterium]